MNSIERFLKTVERKPVDYPASWLGMPDVETLPILFDYPNDILYICIVFALKQSTSWKMKRN